MKRFASITIGLSQIATAFLFAMHYEGKVNLAKNFAENRALVEGRVQIQNTNSQTKEFDEVGAARNMEIIETKYVPTVARERELYVK